MKKVRFDESLPFDCIGVIVSFLGNSDRKRYENTWFERMPYGCSKIQFDEGVKTLLNILLVSKGVNNYLFNLGSWCPTNNIRFHVYHPESVLKLKKTFKTVQRLEIMDCKLSENDLMSLLKCFPNMKFLEIGFFEENIFQNMFQQKDEKKPEPKPLDYLFEFFSNNFPQIQEVRVKDSCDGTIRKNEYIQFINSMKKLEVCEFCVSSIHLDEGTSNSLQLEKNVTLRRMEIDANNDTPNVNTTDLANMITNFPNMEKISVTGSFNINELEHIYNKSFGKGVKHNSLKILIINSDYSGDFSKENLCWFLETFPKLTDLVVVGYSFQSDPRDEPMNVDEAYSIYEEKPEKLAHLDPLKSDYPKNESLRRLVLYRHAEQMFNLYKRVIDACCNLENIHFICEGHWIDDLLSMYASKKYKRTVRVTSCS